MLIVPLGQVREHIGSTPIVPLTKIELGLGCLVLLAGCSQWENDRLNNLNREGVTALERNDLSQAHSKFIDAWKLQPQNADTLYNLASTYHRHEQFELAEKYYREALQQNPDHAACRHNYYLLLVSNNRSAAAWDDAMHWEASKPRSAEAQAELGWLCRLRGDLPAAQTRFEKALSLDPNNMLALLEMGKLYESYHMPDRAQGLYQRVLLQDHQHKEAQALLTSVSRTTPPARAP